MKAVNVVLWYLLSAGSSFSFASLVHPAVGVLSLPVLMPILWKFVSCEELVTTSSHRAVERAWEHLIARPNTHVPHRIERRAKPR